MPKVVATWKDPDWYNAFEDITDEAKREAAISAAYEAGLGEYISIEFDTDTKQVTLLVSSE